MNHVYQSNFGDNANDTPTYHRPHKAPVLGQQYVTPSREVIRWPIKLTHKVMVALLDYYKAKAVEEHNLGCRRQTTSS